MFLFYNHALKRVSKLTGTPISIVDMSKRPDLTLNDVDGIVIPGGADIDPKYYLPYVEEELQEYTRNKIAHVILQLIIFFDGV